MSRRFRASLVPILTLAVAACSSTPDNGVEVIEPDVIDVSMPLTEMVKIPTAREEIVQRGHEAEPARPLPHMRVEDGARVRREDPVVQSALGTALIPTPITTFEGMGTGLAGFTVNSAPPDTDGDIGPNHYVQVVNSGITIFNRSGAKLLGPMNTNTLWNGFSGACATTNDGDATVRYDRIANRWVVAQFSVNGGSGPFYQCIAVSTTADPTGTWNRYQFSYSGFDDYPKMGLWPDAYYFTFNMFNASGTSFLGGKACAMDRAKMLTGAAATMQCFDTGTAYGGLLPADLDGPTLPPAGAPNYHLALNTSTTLAFWKFHVDWTTPASSTFTGPTNITVASYAQLCNGGTCVVQPGTTNKLDALSDRLMNRLVYRNFGDHEALAVSHAVTAGTSGGVRFYEIRSPGTTPTVYQQGTYAPDSAYRWMSSVAFDKSGNMGLGFAVSSSSISPGIRYTGRNVTDALGTMGAGEATLIAGAGAQTGTLTRWGDYSSLNIDPVDDCTFWYTQEYISANGSFNWRTRVGSFKFPTCGTATDDFTISVSPSSQTLAAGTSVSYTVTTAVLSGNAQTINLSVAGLPTGVTGSFSPASVTAGGSSTLTLTAASTAPAATGVSFTVTGTGTAATHTASASVTVTNTNAAPTVSITAPANNSTVSGTVAVSASASDSDGTIASVKFTFPDGTSVTDTTSPYSASWNSATKPDGAGYVITATATDNLGATATAQVTVTVQNGTGSCINGTFNATGLPLAIPDNNTTGITSSLPVTGNGTVATLALSLHITHTYIGDLVVTLISPGGTQYVVSNRAGGSADNIVISNQSITAFNGQTAAGTWQLKVQDLASIDTGTLDSWSLTITGNCGTSTTWSGSASPNLPTIDAGTACTSLTVPSTGDASLAKLDISGTHDYRAVLSGTLAHNGVTVTAFPQNTFPTGAGAFSFTNRAIAGLSGDASGTWTFCITDNDAFGDTGVLSTWSVHN
jgi:subtilisin-like proprotein convertase family protein